jgi:hypothetical protein
MKMRTSECGNVEYLSVGIKEKNPSKYRWVGKVRELYPHLKIDRK